MRMGGPAFALEPVGEAGGQDAHAGLGRASGRRRLGGTGAQGRCRGCPTVGHFAGCLISRGYWEALGVF
jgi:hypothetical protein